ncbi:MAG: hypothetical protein P8X90_36105 [Desulfobacterales bacterium]
MNPDQSAWQYAFKIGTIGAVTAVLLALMGMVETFNRRDIIYNVVTMGQILLLIAGVFMAYLAARRATRDDPGRTVGVAVLTGLITAAGLALLVCVGKLVNLRMVFINASPVLYMILTFHQGLGLGIPLLLLTGGISGFLSGLLFLSPVAVRRVVITAATGVVTAGVLQELLRPVIAVWGPLAKINDYLFAVNGLSLEGAIGLFVLIAVIIYLWAQKGPTVKTKVESLPPQSQRALYLGIGLFLTFVLLILPKVLGLFLSEVMTIVGLYALLGLGLNIVVGFAGLLDLGYVAFFAIGSYTTAVLTSPELGFFHFSFWGALPFAIIMGIFAGDRRGPGNRKNSQYCHPRI